MKEKMTDIMRKFINGIADFSSETTSVVGLYQPATPETLIKKSESK